MCPVLQPFVELVKFNVLYVWISVLVSQAEFCIFDVDMAA